MALVMYWVGAVLEWYSYGVGMVLVCYWYGLGMMIGTVYAWQRYGIG